MTSPCPSTRWPCCATRSAWIRRPGRARLRSRRSSCPPRASRAPRASGWWRSWARGTCATTAPRASSTPPGAATRTCSGCAAGDAGRGSRRRGRAGRLRTRCAALLSACAEGRIAVVPFGGGTSVVGGVEPVADGFAGGGLARPAPPRPRASRVDRTSLTATLRGRPARARARAAARRARGSRSGTSRSRSSISTVGGWVATRSAGQASTGYGRIDELVEGLRMVGPGGRAEPPRGARDGRRAGRCASWWSARRASWA